MTTIETRSNGDQAAPGVRYDSKAHEQPGAGSQGGSPTQAATGLPLRNVVVMMPFHSDDPFAFRLQRLEFLRLQHIIEKALLANSVEEAKKHGRACEPTKPPPAQVIHQRVGFYPAEALRQIAEADVLVALVSSANANVVFELATRVLLRDHIILLLDGNRELLPIYLDGMIHINYRQYRSESVDRRLRSMAADFDSDPLDFNDAASKDCAPGTNAIADTKAMKAIKAITDAVDEHERDLIVEFKHAFGDLAHVRALRPAYLRNLARFITPGAIIESWDTHDPLCVIQTNWKKMTHGYYAENDLWSGPWIVAANDSFLSFYGLESIPKELEDSLDAVTLLDRLQNTMHVLDEKDRRAFLADQERVSPLVFFRHESPPIRVPLRINENHTDPRFRGKLFLPTIVNRARVGPDNGVHRTYHTILYAPLEIPVDTEKAFRAQENGNGR